MFLTWNVSRSDNQRKSKAYCAIAIIECVLVRNLNSYRLSRCNIRHTRCKNVGPFLFNQGGFFPATGCFLKLFFRLFSLFNLALYNSISNSHSQVINSSVFGERKNVDTFYPIFRVILKPLADSRSSKYPRDVYFDLC